MDNETGRLILTLTAAGGLSVGIVAGLTLVAQIVVAFLLLALIIFVLLLLYERMSACVPVGMHGVCREGAARGWASMVFEQGQRKVELTGRAAVEKGSHSLREVGKIIPFPNLPNWDKKPPYRGWPFIIGSIVGAIVEGILDSGGEPQQEPATGPVPVPVPQPAPTPAPTPTPDCRSQLKAYGWRMTDVRRAHIEERHSPDALWPQVVPNSTFSATAWSILDTLVGTTLDTAPVAELQANNGRCRFYQPFLGFITGVNEERTAVTWGATVVYQAFQIGTSVNQPGDVVTAYPE